MNVTVRFGSVAVLKKRFRFMRFGFSDGSCGSVRGFWRFQSPSPKSVENSTFWSLGMAAEPRGGVITQFGSLGPEACEKGPPTRAAGEGPLTRGSTQFGSLGPAKKVLPRVLHVGGYTFGSLESEACEKGTPTRAAGEGPPTQGSIKFGSLGPEACQKGTPTRAAGEGPTARANTQFGSLGPGACESVLPRVLGEYTIRKFRVLLWEGARSYMEE